jgi:acyl-CoA thioesterase FadM
MLHPRDRRHHRVQHYELDTTDCANAATLLNWVEEATFRATNAAGWPIERMRAADFMSVQRRPSPRNQRPVPSKIAYSIVRHMARHNKVTSV